jgi:SAM-dependent methyltransferase
MTLIEKDLVLGRIRLIYRLARFFLFSLKHGRIDFLKNIFHTLIITLRLFIYDLFSVTNVTCNICGWAGYSFYPIAGSGYFEKETICPSCLCQNRHRSLIEIMKHEDIFQSKFKVVEVAPLRKFQEFLLKNNVNYLSFDIERFAMEKGDITNMRYETESIHFFIASHVLEHIPDENLALNEIYRVLEKNGKAILQVPINTSLEKTKEYDKPDLFETGHVRCYGMDFDDRLKAHNFNIRTISVADFLDEVKISKEGLSKDNFYIAEK